MANRLIPMQMVAQTLKNIADEGRPNAVAQIKAVVEYWLWGPSDATITGDRKTSLRRFATFSLFIRYFFSRGAFRLLRVE